MAVCPFVSIGDAIASEIQDARDADAFDEDTFECESLWDQRTVELETRNLLRVDVAPINWTQELKTRGSWKWVCHYQIGVRKRFDVAERNDTTGLINEAEIKLLVNLTSAVLNYFVPVRPDHQGRRLADVTGAAWKEESGGPTLVTIDWDLLSECNQFCAFFPLTYEFSQASA